MADPPLTPAQQLYLEAFDDLLAARVAGAAFEARGRMGRMLNYMLAERGLSLAWGTRWRDSLVVRLAERRRDLEDPVVNDPRPASMTIFADDAIVFQVLGRPQPAGSKKGFKNPHTGRVIITDDAKKSRPWKQQVAGAAAAHVDGRLLTGPVRLDVVFYLARPKGHHGTGRNSGTVKRSAPEYPTVKPDTTKLLRAVEDALTGTCWRDDAQVVVQTARKLYGAPERCEVRITRL